MKKLKAATDTFVELAAIYAVLLLIAGALFSRLEGHLFGESLYWAATTATSTGYGDVSPRTDAGRILAVVLMHLSIFFIAPLIVVRLIDRLNDHRDAFTHDEQQQMLTTLARLEERLERIEASGVR